MMRPALLILAALLTACGSKSGDSGTTAGQRAMSAKAVADVDAAAAEARTSGTAPVPVSTIQQPG